MGKPNPTLRSHGNHDLHARRHSLLKAWSDSQRAERIARSAVSRPADHERRTLTPRHAHVETVPTNGVLVQARGGGVVRAYEMSELSLPLVIRVRLLENNVANVVSRRLCDGFLQPAQESDTQRTKSVYDGKHVPCLRFSCVRFS